MIDLPTNDQLDLAAKRHGALSFSSLVQCHNAWGAVVGTLNDVYPQWSEIPGSGIVSATQAIKDMAARAQCRSHYAVAWYVEYEDGETTLPVTFRTEELAQAHADKCGGCSTEVVPLFPPAGRKK